MKISIFDFDLNNAISRLSANIGTSQFKSIPNFNYVRIATKGNNYLTLSGSYDFDYSALIVCADVYESGEITIPFSTLKKMANLRDSIIIETKQDGEYIEIVAHDKKRRMVLREYGDTEISMRRLPTEITVLKVDSMELIKALEKCSKFINGDDKGHLYAKGIHFCSLAKYGENKYAVQSVNRTCGCEKVLDAEVWNDSVNFILNNLAVKRLKNICPKKKNGGEIVTVSFGGDNMGNNYIGFSGSDFTFVTPAIKDTFLDFRKSIPGKHSYEHYFSIKADDLAAIAKEHIKFGKVDQPKIQAKTVLIGRKETLFAAYHDSCMTICDTMDVLKYPKIDGMIYICSSDLLNMSMSPFSGRTFYVWRTGMFMAFQDEEYTVVLLGMRQSDDNMVDKCLEQVEQMTGR